ncbi:hypothetical protein T261_08930 [Streptomyces lydicus]|nr:hypothetical protein T261_08930 [Streptomyces lydicus]
MAGAFPLLATGRTLTEFDEAVAHIRQSLALFCASRAYHHTFTAHTHPGTLDELAELSANPSVVALDPVREHEEDHEGQLEEEQLAGGDAGGGQGEDVEEQDERAEPAGTGGNDRRPADGEDQEDDGGGVPLLRFSLPRNPDVIAAFLRTRVLRPDSEVRLSGLNALRK